MDNNNAASTTAEKPNMFKQAIAEQLSTIAGIQVNEAITTIEDCKKDGDYSVPVPKINKFKKVQGNPNQVAKTWCEQFKTTDLITDIACDGIYLNFKINKMVEIEQLVSQICAQKENYGSTNQGEGKTVIVEYSSPNIAKPFHAGHLRSTIIGNFLKQLHRALGFNAVGINYLGDWGKQYGLLAIGFQKYGNREQLESNPIKHLYDIYVKINADKKADPTIDDTARAYFKKMEQGDEEALKLWQEFRNLSIVEYQKMYHRLNVQFDEYSGESKFSKEMEYEVSVLEQKGLLQDDQGAKVVDLKEQKLGVALVKKKDGATLYITRDIAAAHARKEKYDFSKMIYVVAAQQDLHFKQLFSILDKMSYSWVKDCVHINFGMVKGMSTRNGTVIFLQDILDEAKSKMKEVMQKNEAKYKEIEDPDTVADIVGLSAVVIQDLSARRIKDYDFDWDRMTSFEGDTGPYLQFSHARLCSMERKAKEQGIEINPKANLQLLVEKEAQELFSIVGKFPAAIQNSYTQLEPCVIVTYAMGLAHAISLALEKIRVLGQEKELAETRLLMYWCARMALNHALRILGLIPLERM